MDLKNIWSFLMISVFVTTCHAFWWSPASSTEAPSVKHIPLGYFRTYTYQPVGAASPLSFSILGTAINPFQWPSRVPSAPILSGSRYELTSTEQSKPPLPPPTTTSTTTTTTTTSTEPPSPPPPPLPTQPSQDRMPIPLINSPNSLNSGSRYLDQTGGAFSQYYGGGIYNRRSLPYFQQQQQPSNFFRPYPYPDYTAPLSPPSNQKPSVQFVPCMCPINLAQMSNDVVETRNIPDESDELTIPKSTDNPNENENSLDDVVVDKEDVADKKSL